MPRPLRSVRPLLATALWAAVALGPACDDATGSGPTIARPDSPGATTPRPPGGAPTPDGPTPGTPTPGTPTPGTPPKPVPAGSWALRQSLTKNWNAGAPGWSGGNDVAFANVEAGSTLVLCAYGYTYPTVPFPTPVDSAGQAVDVAVDTGGERAVQAIAWVLHDAAPGAHTLTGLPDLSTGDGKLFFMEFHHGGGPSSRVVGAATRTLNAYGPPWLTSGSVTMAAGAAPGDLLVAFSFEEESGVGNPDTGYTDPPDGWASLGVQNETKTNIGGEACWRTAPDASPQTVSWSWRLAGAQDPSLFKAAIFAVQAP